MLEDGIDGLKNIFFHNLVLDFSQSDKHISHILITIISHILIKVFEKAISHNFVSHRALAPAEWLDREQGVFRINNRQEFATSWYTFKVGFQTNKKENKQVRKTNNNHQLVHFQGGLSNK